MRTETELESYVPTGQSPPSRRIACVSTVGISCAKSLRCPEFAKSL